MEEETVIEAIGLHLREIEIQMKRVADCLEKMTLTREE
jgi:hypothetical protein